MNIQRWPSMDFCIFVQPGIAQLSQFNFSLELLWKLFVPSQPPVCSASRTSRGFQKQVPQSSPYHTLEVRCHCCAMVEGLLPALMSPITPPLNLPSNNSTCSRPSPCNEVTAGILCSQGRQKWGALDRKGLESPF